MREEKIKLWHDNQKMMSIQKYPNNGNKLIFSGLQDKNGKDIFEGDILEYKNEFNKYHIYKIFYKKGGLCFNTHNNDFYKSVENIVFYEACADMQGSQWIEQCEIIGNIFENPELLTK